MENKSSAQMVLDAIASAIVKSDTPEKEIYRIGELATEYDVTLRTLRFYEDRGLINPARSGSTRLYSPKDRDRLKVIIVAKNTGFSLSDIEDLLKQYDDGPASDIKAIGQKFRTQLEQLKMERSQLEQSIHDLQGAIETIDRISG